jgi:hypothetical protein
VELLARNLTRLDFCLKPDHGRATGMIQLTGERLWVVGRNDLDLSEEVWRSRLEALQAGLQLALKRWPELPGVTIKPASQSTNAAPDQPSEPMPTHHASV